MDQTTCKENSVPSIPAQLEESQISKETKIRRAFVSGLEVVASVGIYRHEQHYEQRVVVGMEVDVVDRYDGSSDCIDDVYDYEDALRAAKLTAESGHFNLIETMAERIAERCLANPDVVSVKVRVEKPDIVENCRSVGIEITRHKA